LAQLSIRRSLQNLVAPARARAVEFRRRGGLWALAPLLVLALDFYQAPILLEHRYLAENLRAEDLLYHSSADLGTTYGHRLHAIIGAIDDPAFLERLRPGPSTLVISLYRGVAWGAVGTGTSAKALLDLLARHSPDDHEAFLRQVAETRGYAPGTVLAFSLKKPVSLGSASIDRVLAVRIDAGEHKTPYALREGLAEVFQRAQGESIRSLVIPCLSVSWKWDANPAFDEYYSTLFQGMKSSRQPQDIYIFFYRGWPTFMLESAVSSFNSRWYTQRGMEHGLTSRLHRLDLRLTLLAASLCLGVATVYTELTWKKAVLLFCSFMTVALGSYEVLEKLLPGEQGDLFAGAKILVTLLEVGLLPLFVKT